jgi:phosphoglycolate phosphatase
LALRILFDLDGTLVHSVPSLCAAANRMLRGLDRLQVDPETYVRFVGRGMVKQIEGVLEHTGGSVEDFDAVFSSFRAFYDADPLSHTTLYEDVSAALRTLSEQGHALGVCTQKAEAPARTVLDAFALAPPVTALTAGDMLSVLKPDPAMVHHCAAQLGNGPIGDVVLVGDSETDAQTAVNADIPFLLYTRGYHHGPVADIPAFARFDSWDEVPNLIARVESHLGATSGS